MSPSTAFYPGGAVAQPSCKPSPTEPGSAACHTTSQSQSLIHMSIQRGLVSSRRLTCTNLSMPKVLPQNRSYSEGWWFHRSMSQYACRVLCSQLFPPVPFNMVSPLPCSSNSCVLTQGTSSRRWSRWATTAFFARAVYGWLRCPVWFTAESHGSNADPRKGMGGRARMGLGSPKRDWFTLTRISIHSPTLNSGCCANRHPGGHCEAKQTPNVHTVFRNKTFLLIGK